MKTFKNILFVTLVLSVLGVVSCSKDKDPEPSKITYLPQISIIGDDLVVISVGSEYEEQGAEASIEGAEAEYQIKGSVNPNTLGVYTLSYEVKNADGFAASTSRTVIVAEEFVEGATDLSGKYIREANGYTSTLTKIVDGVYLMSDAWGSASSGGAPLPVPAYVFSPDGENVLLPQVNSIFGRLVGEGAFDGAKLSINTILLDQGPFERVNIWTKQ